MYKRIVVILIGIFILFVFISVRVMIAEEIIEEEKQDVTRALTIEDFIELAAANDKEFEAILIDELKLQYEKDLDLPARDLILEVKMEYDYFLKQDRSGRETTWGLSKLFPMTGTSITAEYSVAPSSTSTTDSSDFSVYITQPIARNAFGKVTRLHDKIIGIEIDVARHQIVEAYEDYLATIISAYYDWYEAYENLKVAESSYNENLKLLDNIKERQESKIALPIDVNKIKLQALSKKETLITSQEEYENYLNTVKTAIRYEDSKELIPVNPLLYSDKEVSFDADFSRLREVGRTFQVLKLLEEKSSLDVKKSADDLLPSIDLLIGYEIDADYYDLQRKDTMAYAGLSMEFPFPDQVDRAEYNVDKIEEQEARLASNNVYYQLYRDIKNLALVIQREKDLIQIADEKVATAEAILEDESKNYTYGKVSLNDYIDAVNDLDTNRFNKIYHELQLKRAKVEWLRLTDKLISKKEISEKGN